MVVFGVTPVSNSISFTQENVKYIMESQSDYYNKKSKTESMELLLTRYIAEGIEDKLNSNSVGLLDRETIYNGTDKIAEILCTSKLFGKETSVSMCVENLPAVVAILCIIRNPVISGGNLPCDITTTMLVNNGDVPAGISFTFGLGRKGTTGLRVDKKTWENLYELFGFSVMVKCENNNGEIVWNIIVPRVTKSRLNNVKRKNIGNSCDEVVIEGISIKSSKTRKIEKINMAKGK